MTALADRTAIILMIRAEQLFPGSIKPAARAIAAGQVAAPASLSTYIGPIEGVTKQMADEFMADMEE